MKNSNPFSQNEISFDEPSHTYKVIKTGQILTSVSTLIHKFSNEFDPHGYITRAYAKKHGLTVEEVRQMWEDNKNMAAKRGTNFHLQAQEFINTGIIPAGPDADILEDFKSKVKFEGKVFSEVLLYSIEHLVGGTADVVEFFEEDNSVKVSDFKTNKALYFEDRYGKYMLPPFSHLSDCNGSSYSLQLSTYLYLLELKGFKVREDLTIFWINPDNRKIEIVPIPYRRDEVIELLF